MKNFSGIFISGKITTSKLYSFFIATLIESIYPDETFPSGSSDTFILFSLFPQPKRAHVNNMKNIFFNDFFAGGKVRFEMECLMILH